MPTILIYIWTVSALVSVSLLVMVMTGFDGINPEAWKAFNGIMELGILVMLSQIVFVLRNIRDKLPYKPKDGKDENVSKTTVQPATL